MTTHRTNADETFAAVLTRASQKAELEAQGWSGVMLDQMVEAGAAARAESRTQFILPTNRGIPVFALCAAIDKDGGYGGGSYATTAKGGCCGTTRIAAFRRLGSGRKFAQDGAAWTAVIEHAVALYAARVDPLSIRMEDGSAVVDVWYYDGQDTDCCKAPTQCVATVAVLEALTTDDTYEPAIRWLARMAQMNPQNRGRICECIDALIAEEAAEKNAAVQ